MSAEPPSLYEWAGGLAALERLTEAFYREVVQDPLLEPLFGHMDPEHPRYVAIWLAEVFGGPATYTQTRGGYPHMLAEPPPEAPVPRWGWGVAPPYQP